MGDKVGKCLAQIMVDGIDLPIAALVDFEFGALKGEAPVTM
jgi:hypothetical protein